jgi:hypothetical protein
MPFSPRGNARPHSMRPRRCPPLEGARRLLARGARGSRTQSIRTAVDLTASPQQWANTVPGLSGSGKLFFRGMLATERPVQAEVTAATPHDSDPADATRRVENHGLHAVPQPLTAQPLLLHSLQRACHFHDLDEPQTAPVHRCLQWQARPAVIEAQTSFHRRPSTA